MHSLYHYLIYYIDIFIQENGIIRPITEKTEIKSSITELVDSIYIKEGEYINKNDTILSFCTNNSDYQINYQRNRIKEYKKHLNDLNYLVNKIQPPIFYSQKRKQEYIYFSKKKKELITTLQKIEKQYIRNKKLFETKVISEEEYDNSFYNYQDYQNKLASLIENQLNIWQSDLDTFNKLYDESLKYLNQEIKNKELYFIRSPINGTIDNFSGIYKGSNIQSGQTLAIISPDSTIYLEVHITPKNIGFIYIGMPVKIQIDSFNYNEWGYITGKVNEISSDYLIDNKGHIFYKIKCQLDKNYLSLKNGRIGILKKGMTANANFIITKCSLFELLYQNIDNWINPTLN